MAHVIHRHGIKDEKVAYQIEAALIDVYPGLANKVSGHGSDDFGVRHVQEIIAEYVAQPFVPMEPLILISIARSYEEETRSIYNAVRCCWKIKKNRAEKFNMVLAHRRGLVLGVYRPIHWLPARKLNFPWLDDDIQGRYGFIGVPVEPAVERLYIGKRVPDDYRRKGAANPVRFIDLSPTAKQVVEH